MACDAHGLHDGRHLRVHRHLTHTSNPFSLFSGGYVSSALGTWQIQRLHACMHSSAAVARWKGSSFLRTLAPPLPCPQPPLLLFLRNKLHEINRILRCSGMQRLPACNAGLYDV